jgi:hypothetical protein
MMMFETADNCCDILLSDLSEDLFEQWMWDIKALFFHGTTKSGFKICNFFLSQSWAISKRIRF